MIEIQFAPKFVTSFAAGFVVLANGFLEFFRIGFFGERCAEGCDVLDAIQSRANRFIRINQLKMCGDRNATLMWPPTRSLAAGPPPR